MIQNLIHVRGPVVPGAKVVKLNDRGLLHGKARFFNPDGEAFEADVPNVPFYHRMIVDGALALATPEAVKPAGKVKA
jgi:hypothetical protein